MTRLLKLTAVTAVLVACFLGLVSQPGCDGEDRHGSPRQRSLVMTSDADTLRYDIDVAGTADMDRTMTREYGNVSIGFQNNVSLKLENCGKLPVENPRVAINGKRQPWSLAEMLDEIGAGAESDQLKAMKIYDYMKTHVYHDYPLFIGDELHDPLQLINIFGAGFCDDTAQAAMVLFKAAGLGRPRSEFDPRLRALKGHMMCEVPVDGEFQFLDVDQQTYYLGFDNLRPVSGEAVASDHYLARREQAMGPMFQGWNAGDKAAAFFGRDDRFRRSSTVERSFSMRLRPGESIEYRWDNTGKLPHDEAPGRKTLKYFGNSTWEYAPDLDDPNLPEYALSLTDSIAEFAIETPYVVCGGHIACQFGPRAGPDSLVVEVSVDRTRWTVAWAGIPAAGAVVDQVIDDDLAVHLAPAKSGYFFRVRGNRDHLRRITAGASLLVSPLSLPRLRVGPNAVEVTSRAAGPRLLRISHEWSESNALEPPAPPPIPFSPGDGREVERSTVPFRWPSVAGADLYHLQVSRDPDMVVPYRPSFDVCLPDTTLESPFWGLFNPEERYFWRVRARAESGVWGAWGPVWSFSWAGPGVPRPEEPDLEAQRIRIRWSPAEAGARPVRYEIYGSSESGFVPDGIRDDPGPGAGPVNCLGVTTDTVYTVVGPDLGERAANRPFYRIVAVDEAGVRSGPSAQIELPHPFIYSEPVRLAEVGVPYRYQLRTLRSHGDLQKRYVAPIFDYWEREGYEFQLVQGPSWMSIDEDTGRVSGVPEAADAGVDSVAITCIRTYPFEQPPGTFRAELFPKSEPVFAAEWTQTYELRVE